jgi:hypothetical protein
VLPHGFVAHNGDPTPTTAGCHFYFARRLTFLSCAENVNSK